MAGLLFAAEERPCWGSLFSGRESLPLCSCSNSSPSRSINDGPSFPFSAILFRMESGPRPCSCSISAANRSHFFGSITIALTLWVFPPFGSRPQRFYVAANAMAGHSTLTALSACRTPREAKAQAQRQGKNPAQPPRNLPPRFHGQRVRNGRRCAILHG